MYYFLEYSSLKNTTNMSGVSPPGCPPRIPPYTPLIIPPYFLPLPLLITYHNYYLYLFITITPCFYTYYPMFLYNLYLLPFVITLCYVFLYVLLILPLTFHLPFVYPLFTYLCYSCVCTIIHVYICITIPYVYYYPLLCIL